MRKTRLLTLGGAVVVVAAVFQLFFRYQYIPDRGIIQRIDRISGNVCVMPCTPAPTATPYDMVSVGAELGDKYQLLKERAIRLAQQTEIGRSVDGTHEGFSWTASNFLDDILTIYSTPAPNATPIPVPHAVPTLEPDLVVCYCDKKNDFGWRWDVHTDTGEAFYTSDTK
jgi:hypothetical protein